MDASPDLFRSPDRVDVVVVGARCAGAATARLLAQRAHRVVVLERAALPSDTLSTHGLARGGVVQLARWGLLERVLADGAPAVREVRLGLPGQMLTRRIKQHAGVDLLVAPRRHRLDALLADAAREAGAEVLTGAKVTGLISTDGRVEGVRYVADGVERTLHAAYVVGADGRRSPVAGWVGARTRRRPTSDTALFYAYVRGDWPAWELHVADRAWSGVFPTHDGEACVWLQRPQALLDGVRTAGSDRQESFVRALDATTPDLAAAVRAGEITSPVRGFLAPENFVRQASGPGWALVGDAGYHRDPITGHGITDAFRDAELLAASLDAALCGRADGGLREYAVARDRALTETYRLTRALAAYPPPDRFVELQRRLSEALDREATELAARPAPAGPQTATDAA